jgi:hypothetical protein
MQICKKCILKICDSYEVLSSTLVTFAVVLYRQLLAFMPDSVQHRLSFLAFYLSVICKLECSLCI